MNAVGTTVTPVQTHPERIEILRIDIDRHRMISLTSGYRSLLSQMKEELSRNPDKLFLIGSIRGCEEYLDSFDKAFAKGAAVLDLILGFESNTRRVYDIFTGEMLERSSIVDSVRTQADNGRRDAYQALALAGVEASTVDMYSW